MIDQLREQIGELEAERDEVNEALLATYMQAHFRRICTSRGAKKAAGAVAHSLFVRCFMVATGDAEYRELGGTYYDDRRKEAVTRRLVQRLEGLGYQVALAPTAA